MLELLRYISHIPFLIPHAAMRDTVLGGYAIPKDTQVRYPDPVFVPEIQDWYCLSRLFLINQANAFNVNLPKPADQFRINFKSEGILENLWAYSVD